MRRTVARVVKLVFLASFLLSSLAAFAAPSITSLSPTSGGVGATVTITGSNFGSTRGSSTVKFNGTAGTPSTWSATSIKLPVPAGATSGNVVVTVSGVASNGKAFTVLPTPTISSLSPTSGAPGASVTITGTNFGATQGTSTIKFNGTAATPTSWSDTSIVAPVPSAATTGNVVVTVSGVASTGVGFTVAPSISSISPTSGAVGALVTISGKNFQSTQGSNTVTFNGTSAPPSSWTNTQITVPVPAGASTGPVVVTAAGLTSNSKTFTVKPTPTISSVSPNFGAPGVSITISGTNFGTTQGTSTVSFNGAAATPTSWGASQIIVPVPAGATTGNLIVHTSAVDVSGGNFTVETLTSLSLTPLSSSLPVNSVQRFRAVAHYSDGSTQDVAGNASWSSSDTTIAAFGTGGVLTAISQGSATIQATFGGLNDSTVLVVKGPSFVPVGDLNYGRWNHTATLLPDGRVLIVGGGSTSSFVATAELYDPISRTFTTTGSLGTARISHTATLLQNGKVLIVGGDELLDSFGDTAPLATAELYDPTMGLFTATGGLHTARSSHIATLLSNGKVLITGGGNTAEIYDPVAGTFADTGITTTSGHTATLLNDGTVLLAGGSDPATFSDNLSTSQLYDSSAGTLTTTGNLMSARGRHTATLLSDGKVLIAGGVVNNFNDGPLVLNSELYDPIGKSFSGTASLAVPRQLSTATLLTDSAVLVVGGNSLDPVTGNLTPIATAEVFDDSTQNFNGAGALNTARDSHTATMLNDGTVLIAGGNGSSGILSSAELYAPPLPPPSSLQITPSTTNIVVGQGQQFKAFDELGQQRFDVTWSVSDSSIASLTLGGAPTLTALAAGQEVLTANVQGVIAQLQITIAPSSLQVTPATVNMQVGDSREFSVVDNLGRPSGDVTWTISDDTLATITAGNQPTLTALATGQVTLTATVEGVTAQAQVTILNAGAIAPGTPLWSNPPLPGFAPIQLVQAVPANGSPDLYSIQRSADGGQTIIQALTSDGQQLWQTSRPAVNGNSVPDGSGGVLVTEHNTCLPGQTDPMTIVDLDGTTGQPKWQLAAAGVQDGSGNVVYCYPDDVKALEPQIAIRGDGAVVIAAMTNNGLPPLTIDGAGVSIESSTSTDSSGITHFDDFSPMGPPIVDSDDSVYVEYEVRNIAYPPKITSAILYVLKVAPDNSLVRVQLSSVTTDTNLLPGRIIPDGNGGVLATWTIAPSSGPVPPHPYQASHLVGGVPGPAYDLPFAPKAVPPAGAYPTLVLGENGTAFATDGTNSDPSDPTDGPQIVSFDLNSGTPNWSYQAETADHLTLIASAAGNGLVAKVTENGSDTILRFDSTGTAAADPFVGVGLDYITSTLWIGLDAETSQYAAAPITLSTSNWFQTNQRGTNQAAHNLKVTSASNSGPNENSIVSALRGIKTMLDADAKSSSPKYTSCSSWLGSIFSPSIQNFLTGDDLHSFNIGHAVFWFDTDPPTSAASIGAFTGGRNRDQKPISGLPTVGFGITVNDEGAFFNATNSSGQAWRVGRRGYSGNTLRAQSSILLHELSHALSNAGAGSSGFQSDFGDATAGRANDNLVDQHCRRFIEDLDNWFWIETPWLPNGTVGAAYNTTLTARGGTPPYTWSIIQGALPGGLSLNSSTGTITGTPALSGSISFTLQATDAASAPNTRTATETYTITVP